MKQETRILPVRTAPVALFIDGENLSHETAPMIVAAADELGQRGIRRVYGDAARLVGWRQQGTLQLVDSAQGKNAADMLLALEAMEAVFLRGIGTIAIASRDRDFSHLARKLTEHGVHVVGIGPAALDCAFRKSCSDYRVIGSPVPQPAALRPPSLNMTKVHQWVVTAIGQAEGKTLSISALAKIMQDRHKVTKAQLPHGNWKTHLSADRRFEVGEGQMVRLAKKKPPLAGGL